MIEDKFSAFIQNPSLLALTLYYDNIQIIVFLFHVSRVSQEEVKKWGESLENLISHECKFHPLYCLYSENNTNCLILCWSVRKQSLGPF